MEKQGTEVFRLHFEDGTHIATVYDAEQAAVDRDYYAEKYGCVVVCKRGRLARDPRGT